MHIQSDEAVMKRVKSNDSHAIGELIDRYHSKLFQFFYRMSGDRNLAEDLVQECFLRLYKYRASYQEDKLLFNWLFQIARNIWSNAYQNQQRKPETVQFEAVHLTDHTINPGATRDLQQLIMNALLELPELDRQLVILFHLKGFNYRELSALFEMSEGALRVKLCRALKMLGTILKNLGYEHG